MKSANNSNRRLRAQASTPWLLTLLSLSSLLAAITVDMVNPVLAWIGDSFHSSKTEASWVVSGIAIVLAIGVPLYGRLSDLVNLRKLFAFAASVLALGSLLCALAPNLPLLVFGRMVQGAGMSAIPVLSVIAISNELAEGRRIAALGIVAGSIGVGTAFGPVMGGVIGQAWGWPALFWITFVLSLLIAAGSLAALPDRKPNPEHPHGRRSFDWIGGALLGLTVGLSLFGVTQAETAGLGAFSSVGCLTGALVAALLFIWRIRTAAQPFVPPILFRNRTYVRAVVIAFFAMFAYFALIVYVPVMLVEVNGLAPGEAGLALLPGGAAVALLAPWVGRVSDRTGTAPLILTGLIVMGLSALWLFAFGTGASPMRVAFGVTGAGIAFSFINSPLSHAAVGALRQEQVGAGMGIFQGALYLGAGSGAGIVGALLHALQHAADSLNPLYHGDAAAYADAFLATACSVLIALIAAACGLRDRGSSRG